MLSLLDTFVAYRKKFHFAEGPQGCSFSEHQALVWQKKELNHNE